MRYGTVCSGAEAFGFDWEAMGFKCAFHAEIATHPSAVLRYHYPNTPNYGDFTKIEASESTRIDLLAGGTPCQDFSIAGLRAGVAGAKGNLTLEFLLLAKRLGVKWILWENVPGTFSSISHDAPHPSPPPPPLDMELDGQEMDTEDDYDSIESHAFQSFLAGLSELGYGAAYRTFDAQYFGVPQRRRRIFVVAHLGDWRPAAAVLFESESLRGNTAPRKSKAKDIAGTIEASLGRSRGAGTPPSALTVAGTLTATESGLGPASRIEMVASGYLQVSDASSVAASEGGNTTGEIPVATCLTHHGQRLDFDTETFLVQPIAFDTTQITSKANMSKCEPGSACHTLTRGAHPPAVALPVGVRRLMPLETERLMGWADNYTQYGINSAGKQYKIADGPRYQMCGNGWAKPVANWIAGRIMMVTKVLLEQTRHG